MGAGPRKPGLDPYLTFIVHAVFLKFYNRNYKHPTEKWEIAEKCLQQLDHFVQMYEINPMDFPLNGQPRDENSSPGYHIMLWMHTQSEFLRLILHLVDEAIGLLESYTNFPGKQSLEQCVFYALRIIEKTLCAQDIFFETHFTSNSSQLLYGLNKLLLGVNPRSGKPDHMLNITKYVTFNNSLPQHCSIAIKILTMIARQPNVNQILLGVFTQSERVKLEIRQGFVECLEHEAVEMEDEDQNIELKIQESVIILLQECLPQSAPNLAHYLLGFDTTKDIRMTRMQQPGIMDFPSTCAKSLVTILDTALENSIAGRTSNIGQARLIENAYALLYALCFNGKTSEIILRSVQNY